MVFIDARNGRWLARALLGLFIVLAAAGHWLQVLGNATLTGPGPPAVAGPLVLLSWAAIGALLAARMPQHPIGWLFLVQPLLFAMDDFAFGYAYYGLEIDPGSLPFVGMAVLWLHWTGRAIGPIGLTLQFLLFPTGRLPSPRWRMLVWISGISTAIFIISSMIAPLPLLYLPFVDQSIAVRGSIRALTGSVTWITYIVNVASPFVALVALFLRLRRARGVERQQLKWFAYAATLIVPGLTLLILSLMPGSAVPGWVRPLAVVLFLTWFAGLALASALAILRYRLWDIDILIQRTLVYGLLSGALAIAYFSIMVLFQQVLQVQFGQRSSLSLAVSTLVIAGLFSPLRRRIQRFIDRRFYRREYDARETLVRFSAAIQNEVELAPLSEALLKVVDSTLHPASVGLWLKEH